MKPFRERNPILVGVISVAVIAIAMIFALSLNKFTFLRGVYTVRADFADAAGLTPDNEVRIAGLKVGRVRSVELAPGSSGVTDRVRVTMEVGHSIKLGNATQAEIKLKTILGAKFVDIIPKGGAPLVTSGQVIPLDRTRVPFEIYQVTNRSVETIGKIDATALNDALRELAKLTDDPQGNLGRALQGLSKSTAGLKERDADLQDLVRSGAQILDVLGSRSQELGRIFDSGSQLLGALSARSDALRRFVRGSDALASQLSDLLAKDRGNLDPALNDLHTALVVVGKDIGPLEKAVQGLGPGAKSFGSAFLQGHWGDIWTQSLLNVPLPPLLPGGPAPLSGNASKHASAHSLALILNAGLDGGAL